MVKLDFGVPYAGDEHWNSCMSKDDCKDPKPTSWTVSEVHSVTSDSFKNTLNEEVAKYLQDRIYPGSVMNEMLVYMTDNQATGADAASNFLERSLTYGQSGLVSMLLKKSKLQLSNNFYA